MNNKLTPYIVALGGMTLMLIIYFSIVSLVSGYTFALKQFGDFWYYIIALSFGFGIQLGLYTYLKITIKNYSLSRKIITVSGSTSTIAMISCCAHYLVNILPIIGVNSLVTIIGQYQIKLFWLGIIINIISIIYILSKIKKFNHEIS